MSMRPEQLQIHKLQAFLSNETSPSSSALRLVSKALSDKRWNAVLFGGAARDILLNGRDAVPRDLDVVVDGVTLSDLDQTFAAKRPRRNKFHGLCLDLEGIKVDMWPLDRTRAFFDLDIRRPTFTDLVSKTTFFNVENIAIDLGTGGVYESGFFQALHEGVLEVNYEKNPFPLLCIVRAAKFMKCYDLRMGPRLQAFIQREGQRATISQLMVIQRGYFGKEVVSASELEQVLRA